jgi:DNA mismatch endonuclease (patch repair protein)
MSAAGMSGAPLSLDAGVRARLSSQRTKDTGPEMLLRRALHAAGVRYRVHRRDLPGSPDIVVPRLRLIVFVDGCFWHCCPDHGNLPRNNSDWWATKLARNVIRDREQDAALRSLGWEVLRVWEHESVEERASMIAARWHAAGPV